MKGRLETLDGLRGVAALAVMAGHATGEFGAPEVFPRFYLAVDFFFLLSGFIMARTYQERLSDGWVAGFYRTRALRLWPLLVLGTALGAVVELLAGRTDGLLLNTILGTLCFPGLNATAPLAFPLNSPQWSLFAEAVANLVHGAAFRRLRRWVLGSVVAGAGLILVFAAARGEPLYGGVSPASLWVGLARVAFSYSLGLVLATMPLPRIAAPFPVGAGLMLAVMAFPRWFHAGPGDLVATAVVWPAILILCAADQARVLVFRRPAAGRRAVLRHLYPAPAAVPVRARPHRRGAAWNDAGGGTESMRGRRGDPAIRHAAPAVDLCPGKSSKDAAGLGLPSPDALDGECG